MLWTLFQIAVVLLALPLIVAAVFYGTMAALGAIALVATAIRRAWGRISGGSIARVYLVCVGLPLLLTSLLGWGAIISGIACESERTKRLRAEWAEACRRTPSLCATDGGAK